MHRAWGDSRAVAVGLVLANAVPLVGVVSFGWNLHSLLVIYWVESAAVGVESVAKIRRAEGEDDPEELPSLSLNDTPVTSFVGRSNLVIAGFFATHYGGFWVVHGAFVMAFPLMFSMPLASPSVVALSAVGLVGYHVASYRTNYVGEREYERSGPVTLMVEPYRRVFVLHLTIVIGAFAVVWIGAPAGALVVMVLVKTVLDLRAHWAEHERARRRDRSQPSGLGY